MKRVEGGGSVPLYPVFSTITGYNAGNDDAIDS